MNHPRKILVTGAAGFIGSHVVDRLLKDASQKVVGIDNLSLGVLSNLENANQNADRFKFEKIDCTQMSEIERIVNKQNTFDWVIHCAVEPLEQSLTDPSGSFDRNVSMVMNLCELQRKGAFQKLLSFSSSEVYGSALSHKMSEDHPLIPHTPYAASKASGDLLIESYCKTFQTEAVLLRPFNNYGPRQNTKQYAGIIPKTLRILKEGGSPILCGTGDQTRDFIYVEDTAEAVVTLMSKAVLDGRVFNVASGIETSVKDILHLISELWGYKGALKKEPLRAGDVMRHCGDMTKFETELGAKIKLTPFQLGLKKTVEWYQKTLTA